jgi:hypothetical protein
MWGAMENMVSATMVLKMNGATAIRKVLLYLSGASCITYPAGLPNLK